MAYTSADLDRLDRAIASGTLTVEIGGRKITYHDIDALLKARAHVAATLASASGQPRRGSFWRTTFAGSRGE
jgi:arginase family enzyme